MDCIFERSRRLKTTSTPKVRPAKDRSVSNVPSWQTPERGFVGAFLIVTDVEVIPSAEN